MSRTAGTGALTVLTLVAILAGASSCAAPGAQQPRYDNPVVVGTPDGGYRDEIRSARLRRELRRDGRQVLRESQDHLHRMTTSD